MADLIDDFIRKGIQRADALREIGKEAPHISKKFFRLPASFHGLETEHIGEDLTKAEMTHLDESVGRMAEMYPDAHDSIMGLYLDNSLQGVPKQGVEYEKWADMYGLTDAQVYGTMGNRNSIPFNHVSLNNWAIDASRDLPLARRLGWTHVANEAGEMGQDALARTYTHEFGHVIQNSLTNLVSGTVNPEGYSQEEFPKVMENWHLHKDIVRSDINSYFEDILPGLPLTSGEARSHATGALLGSRYAGTADAELYPEINVMRHHGHSLYTPELEGAMRNVDEDIQQYMDVNAPKIQRPPIDPRLQVQANTTMRSGARPRSRSAMGGIAYLQ